MEWYWVVAIGVGSALFGFFFGDRHGFSRAVLQIMSSIGKDSDNK